MAALLTGQLPAARQGASVLSHVQAMGIEVIAGPDLNGLRHRTSPQTGEAHPVGLSAVRNLGDGCDPQLLEPHAAGTVVKPGRPSGDPESGKLLQTAGRWNSLIQLAGRFDALEAGGIPRPVDGGSGSGARLEPLRAKGPGQRPGQPLRFASAGGGCGSCPGFRGTLPANVHLRLVADSGTCAERPLLWPITPQRELESWKEGSWGASTLRPSAAKQPLGGGRCGSHPDRPGKPGGSRRQGR